MNTILESSKEGDSNDIEVPYDPTRLLLEGVVENCTDEMIQLYINLIFNSNLDETFKIEEFRRNRRRVLLKFSRNFNFDDVTLRQKKIPELCSNLITFHRVKVPDTVRVYDLANNCTKEVLNLYFSNTKISQGGDIKSIKLFSYENKALVQFKNYLKVDDVLARAHIICESLVKLEKFYGPIEDEYFREEEEAFGPGEAQGESSKDKLGKRKSLASLTSLKSFTSPLATIDKTKLVISNIQENISIQQLEFYIQLITSRLDINEINWSLEYKGKLLIDFKKEIDINKVLNEFNNNSLNNLNGKPVQIETVNLTRTLVVLVKDSKVKKSALKIDSPNDDEEYKPETIPATRDLLDLYFVNRQRSGGGEIESIERKSSRYWLIVMKDQRAVKEILSRKHTIDEKPIKVFPYYDNFGLPYMFRPLFDEYYNQSSSNTAFKLKIKDDRLRYFCKVKNLHKKLNDILSESNAVSRYNKSESNILYVNYVEKQSSIVPYMERMWRLRVKESIEYFLQIYKYEKLTLSHNQWATICKTKQINESLLNKQQNSVDDEFDDSSMIDASSILGDKIKYVGNNCAIISINETASNVEISIVGPNNEVDRFIVKIKDIICKAYFTFELEEKIIKFKTYLYECEELLSKWLNESDGFDSDTEVTLASARSNDSDSLSISYNKKGDMGVKLNKSRRNTIDEFISKLERDHLDMELSYGKLFQELGYTFLSGASQENDDEEDAEYKDYNDRLTSSLDESVVLKSDNNESQMDKIKFTLDDLRARINEMRKKFRQFLIKTKRAKVSRQADLSEDGEDDFDDFEDENDDLLKLCVYVKEQAKIISFKVHRKCRIRELRQILFEKITDQKVSSVDDLKLIFNNLELSNEAYTINDYGISDKSTITLEFR